MNNHEFVEFIQQRQRELEEVSLILQSVRDKLNDARAKSQAESEERIARLNAMRAKAGLPVMSRQRPIITLNNITEGE